MPRGPLITIEGIDGAGKSTLARALAEHLRARGLDVQLLREPGGVELSERIRALLLDPALSVTPRAEALLYAGARAQLVDELIEPHLARGSIVLMDRFLDSSLAYQGAGRGLGLEAIAQINGFATGGLEPDVTLLLEIPPDVGRRRKDGAPQRPDRLELEDEAFFERVAEGYSGLARAHPTRIRTIDARALPAEVLDAALAAVGELFPGGH